MRVLAALLVVSIAHAQDSRRDFLVTESQAFLLMPPDVVCGPTVTWMSWTPDGKYLLAKRQVMRIKAHRTDKSDPSAILDLLNPVGQEVVAWNANTRQAKSVFSLRVGEGQIGEVHCLAGGAAVISAFGPSPASTSSVLPTPRLFLATTSAARLLMESSGEFFEVSPSPSGDMFFVLSGPIGPRSARIFTSTGNPLRSVSLDANESLMWLPSNELVMLRLTRGGNREGATREAFSVNPVTGAMSAVRFPSLGPTRDTAPIQLREFQVPLAHPKVKGAAGLLWLEAPEDKAVTAALVSADGVMGRLSPLSNEVAYVVQGAAMVRPIAQVPMELFHEARRAAERSEALSKAKQVGLALLMFSTDNDDALPGKAGWEDKLAPYAKNKSLFSNFTYTFSGGRLSDIENPTQTELGYVPVEGGRAVVYADGHAKFIKD